ncbi:hypothetical protein [Terriglobus sp.]|uniref:hypothetical protein n=1 Tax=Terriglobus sp. TaxID=1889013 RepID=UPI003B0022E2
MVRQCSLVVLLTLALGTGVPGIAQSGNEQPFPRFVTKQGKLDSDGFPVSGARLCLLPEQTTCYTMPSQPIPGGGGKYDFGLSPRSDKHALPNGGAWTLFAATFNAGGSGSLTRFALLRVTPERTLQNLLPDVALVDEGEAALWDAGSASPFPLLVTAEPYWDMDHGESHFEAHRQTVQAWKFNPQTNQYVSVLRYRTTQKYGGDDGKPATTVGPLTGERARVLQQVTAKP